MKTDLALIGAGYWGKNLARNFHALGALRTICDAHKSTLALYGDDYAGVEKTQAFEDVLSDPEIHKVAIATPAETHFDVARRAIEAGKDVYVEKPLCLDVGEAKALIELAAQNERILMVGHLLQYHSYVEKLREMVERGELGKLYSIVSNRLNLGKIRQEENSLWSFAPHDISVILALAGRLPETVNCQGQAYLTEGIADCTLTQMGFSGGLRAHVFVSWLNPFKEQKLTVVGSEGMAVFDDTKPWDEKLVVYRDYLRWEQGDVPTANKQAGEPVVVPESEPLRSECMHFLECCQHRTQPRTNGEEGLRVLEVLSAAQSSLSLGGKNVDSQASPSAGFFAHPTAVIDEGAEIGPGTKVWHFSHISSNAKIGPECKFGQNVFVAPNVTIGRNVKVQNNVSIYTGTTIEDDVFLGPSCVLTNVTNPRSEINRQSQYEKTIIRKGATIGANATIVCGVEIGRYAFIGAGAVVTKDVPEFGLVKGVPGKRTDWISRHGCILEFDDQERAVCRESGQIYRKTNAGVHELVVCLD